MGQTAYSLERQGCIDWPCGKTLSCDCLATLLAGIKPAPLSACHSAILINLTSKFSGLADTRFLVMLIKFGVTRYFSTWEDSSL